MTSKAISNGAARLLSFWRFFEQFDRVVDGQNGPAGIIGNFAAEFLFESDHELDGVETVGARSSMKLVDRSLCRALTPRCSTTIFFICSHVMSSLFRLRAF